MKDASLKKGGGERMQGLLTTTTMTGNAVTNNLLSLTVFLNIQRQTTYN